MDGSERTIGLLLPVITLILLVIMVAVVYFVVQYHDDRERIIEAANRIAGTPR